MSTKPKSWSPVQDTYCPFVESIPRIVTYSHQPCNLRGNVLNMCVKKVLFYGNQTWAVVTEDVQRLDQMNLWCVLERSHSSGSSPIAPWSQFYQWHAVLEPTEVPWTHDTMMDEISWAKKATMHYVNGRQPRDWLRKRLCDAICADTKSLNLSNEDANNRAAWRRAIKPKKMIQHADVLRAHVDSGR